MGEFLNRPLTGDWPYVWLDATYPKVRQGRRIVCVAAIIAVAVNTDGLREIISLGTDPDATMATTARNRRLEPSYKQHGVVDDLSGVILDVEVTTGEIDEGQVFLERLDATAATTGAPISTATADAGYAYAKVFAGLEVREITGIIPTKAEPIRSKVPLRRFRYDAKHDHVKCPRGKILRLNKAKISHGRFFASKARDCKGCDLAAICLSPSRVTKAVVIVHDYPALLRARRRRERWSEDDGRLYQRHRWRSEGFHGEARHGTDWRGRCAVGSKACASSPIWPPPRSTSSGLPPLFLP